MSIIQFLKKMPVVEKSSNHTIYLLIDYVPTLMIKYDMHTVRAWGFQRSDLFYCLPNSSTDISQVSYLLSIAELSLYKGSAS